ncbi:hypothetical protein A3758_14440 [Oleiphilus sp. HI0118]|nr:hypothetical protein A3758_14440 [Oleiphilus sp. HI0118]
MQDATVAKAESAEQIRSERFDNFIDSYALSAQLNGLSYSLENLSDTGAKLTSDSGSIVKGNIYPFKVLSSENHLLFECQAEVIWVNESDDTYSFGIDFTNHILPRELLNSLDRLMLTEYEIEKELSAFDSIPEDFRLLVFEIENFFIHLKKHVDELEENYETRNEESKASLLDALEVRFGNYVSDKLNHFGRRLYDYLDHLKDKQKAERYLNFFRSELNEFYLQSPYAKRAMEKPLGYAGDYEMMNQVYRNGYEGKSLFAKLIHRYTVNEAAAISVRERKAYLAQKIDTRIQESQSDIVSIASVACGPAQEWGEYFERYTLPEDKQIEIVLIDQDKEALLEARRNVSSAVRNAGMTKRVKVRCEPVAVKDILERNSEALALLSNGFDMVYSAGLYDYLPGPIAKSLTKILSKALKPNGQLIIGNFHPSSSTRAICEFSVDWRLIYRTEQEVADLGSELEGFKIESEVDSQSIVVYLLIKN